MATDRRREKQADAVAREVASSGVRVESDSGYQAVLVEGRRVNHLLHFFVGIFTCGLWWLVWLFFGITGGERRYVVRTDEFGNTRVERPNSRPNPAIVAAVIGGVVLLLILLLMAGPAILFNAIA